MAVLGAMSKPYSAPKVYQAMAPMVLTEPASRKQAMAAEAVKDAPWAVTAVMVEKPLTLPPEAAMVGLGVTRSALKQAMAVMRGVLTGSPGLVATVPFQGHQEILALNSGWLSE